MNTQLDHFEQALLTELRQNVAERAAAPAPRRWRRRVGVIVAATATAAVIALTAAMLRPSPAYAVESQSDGDVKVTITSLEDAEGLEGALAAEGVEAEVDYEATLVPSEDDFKGGAGDDSGVSEKDDGEKGLTESEGEPKSTTPKPGDELMCGAVDTQVSQDAVTLHLPAEFVNSDQVLMVTMSGSAEDGMAGLRFDTQGDGPLDLGVCMSTNMKGP